MKTILRLKKLVLICLFSIIGIQAAWSQSNYTGTITDEKQLPVPGVSVMVKGSKNGTKTNASGNFTIMASSGDALVIRSIGYISLELTLTAEKSLKLIMKADEQSLNEVVVTALGIKKEKKNLGYAIQEVKGEELVKAREANPLNSLVGKVAGLQVGISPELMGRPLLYLRGDRLNLIVVDGIPISSDTYNISPDDIETYTILKGPAAAALYGYQALNGAILITTKKGKANAKGFAVDFNSSTQFNSGFIALPKTQDEYGAGSNSSYAFVDGKGGGVNDADYDIWGPRFEGQLIPQYDSPVVNGVRQATPWTARGKDNLARFIQTGILSTNNLAFSSATDKYNLRVSASNTYQRGIVPNTDLNTANFNILGGYNLSSKLKFEASLNYSRQTTDNIPDVNYGPNSVVYNITVWGGADWDIADMRDYWQPGKVGLQSKYAEYQRYHNPYFMSYEWLRGQKKNDIYGTATLTYHITNELEASARTQITTYDLFRSEKMPFSAHPYGREAGLGDYREDKRSQFENNTQLLLKYNKESIGNFLGINALLGGNARSFAYNSGFTTTDYLNVPNVYNFSNSLNPVKAFNFRSNMLVLSAFYSVDFSLSKYATVSTTGRIDKNSSLPPGNNSAFYPSVSLSTVLSDYIKLPSFISFSKLRASFANVKDPGLGTTDFIGATPLQSYPVGYGTDYLSPYGGPSYEYLSSVYKISPVYNNQLAAVYTDNLIDFASIKPQSRTNFEAGVDLKFLKNRIGIDATYFSYVDGPKLYNSLISPTTGYKTNTINAIKTRKNGFEISLSGSPIVNPDGLNWDVQANWSTFKQVYDELVPGQQVIDQFFRAGDRTDKIYGSALAKSPDGKVIHNASGTPIILPVKQFLGNASPDWVWGLNNRFNYKNFGLSFQLDGKVGGVMQDYVRLKTFQGGRHIETTQGKMGAARLADYIAVRDKTPGYTGTWVGDGVVVSNGQAINFDPVTGVIANYSQLTFAPNTTPQKLQSYIGVFYGGAMENTMMSRTYAKLREVTLSYTLPSQWLQKSFIKKASITVVGRNLLYFINSKYNDVDVDQYSGTESGSGLQTPTTRSYGINLNVSF